MVEIFITNVQCTLEATALIKKLTLHFPCYKINFDLTDCDNILRVEGDNIFTGNVINLMHKHNYTCVALE